MKKLFFLLIWFTSASFANDFLKGTEPIGFRNIKFGTPISKIKVLKKMDKKITGKNEITFSSKTNQIVKIGNVNVILELIFEKNKFSTAIIYFDINDYDYIVNLCIQKYGYVTPVNNNYCWIGDKTLVLINKYKNLGTLTISSKKIIVNNMNKAINDF